jgi:hypothetical protein
MKQAAESSEVKVPYNPTCSGRYSPADFGTPLPSTIQSVTPEAIMQVLMLVCRNSRDLHKLSALIFGLLYIGLLNHYCVLEYRSHFCRNPCLILGTALDGAIPYESVRQVIFNVSTLQFSYFSISKKVLYLNMSERLCLIIGPFPFFLPKGFTRKVRPGYQTFAGGDFNAARKMSRPN